MRVNGTLSYPQFRQMSGTKEVMRIKQSILCILAMALLSLAIAAQTAKPVEQRTTETLAPGIVFMTPVIVTVPLKTER